MLSEDASEHFFMKRKPLSFLQSDRPGFETDCHTAIEAYPNHLPQLPLPVPSSQKPKQQAALLLRFT
jgi:hypothetical protein